ncbi:MAG: tetratricopeptide repeat protein [Phycisphaerae bacterium]|nr:tetratricopeptide repeat protein [Phycisphaerae bacterium]
MSENARTEAFRSPLLSGPRLNVLLPLAVSVLIWLAFSPSLNNGFVWDDEAAIQHNERIKSLNWENIRWMFTTRYTGPYQPLSWLSLAVDHELWGSEKARGYHFTSIAIHTVTAVAFFFLARLLLTAALGSQEASGREEKALPGSPYSDMATTWGAAAAMALFALHPLRVESVAWATERRDVLSGMFFVLTILSYLRYARLKPGDEGRVAWYVATLALFLMAVLSKATVVTLPVVLVVLDFYPLRRVSRESGVRGTVTLDKALFEKIPLFLLAFTFGLLAIAGQAEAGAMMGIAKHGLVGRIIVAIQGIGFYVSKTLVPIGLSPFYELPEYPLLIIRELTIRIAIVLGVTALVIRKRKRLPGLAAAWLCFVILALPMLGFVQVGLQIAADRYSYLPGMSLALVFGGCIRAWWPRDQRRVDTPFQVPAALVILLIIVLTPLTRRQCRFWQFDIALWMRAGGVDPRSSMAFYNLGTAWDRRFDGRGSAIAAYRWAVQLRPDHLLAWQNLGNALLMDGKNAEAVEAYQKILESDPSNVDMLGNMSLALMGMKHYDRAAEYAQKAISVDPDSAPVRNTLGVVLLQKSRIEPDLKRREALLDESIQAFRGAIQADPKYPNTYQNLLAILYDRREHREVVQVLRKAVQSMPDDLEMMNNLAYVLATCSNDDIRNGREALELALRVCEKSRYQRVGYLDTLAAAYAEVGDFENAVRIMEQAIEIASQKDAVQASRLKQRRQEYLIRRPMRLDEYN